LAAPGGWAGGRVGGGRATFMRGRWRRFPYPGVLPASSAAPPPPPRNACVVPPRPRARPPPPPPPPPPGRAPPPQKGRGPPAGRPENTDPCLFDRQPLTQHPPSFSLGRLAQNCRRATPNAFRPCGGAHRRARAAPRRAPTGRAAPWPRACARGDPHPLASVLSCFGPHQLRASRASLNPRSQQPLRSRRSRARARARITSQPTGGHPYLHVSGSSRAASRRRRRRRRHAAAAAVPPRQLAERPNVRLCPSARPPVRRGR
jgi:hypothetical protein